MEDRFLVVRFSGNRAYKGNIADNPFTYSGIVGIFSNVDDARSCIHKKLDEMYRQCSKYGTLKSIDIGQSVEAVYRRHLPEGEDAEYTVEWRIYEVHNYVQ